MKVRRVVTGFGPDIQPTVLFDGPAPADLSLPPDVGAELLDLWRSPTLPLDTTSTDDPADGDFELMPAGALFRIIDFAPGEHAPMWHTTASVDFIYIASGQVSMDYGSPEAPVGRVTLSAGDTIVQRGIPHAWVNTGEGPCRMVNVSVAATLPDGIEPG